MASSEKFSLECGFAFQGVSKSLLVLLKEKQITSLFYEVNTALLGFVTPV